MSAARIFIRRAGSASQDWEPFDLPPPAEAGIPASSWADASLSTAFAWIQRACDPSFAYLLSCRRGLCDVCAVRVNGKVVTACTTPVQDGMRIEPTKTKLALVGTIIDISLVRRARVSACDVSDPPVAEPFAPRTHE